MVAGGDILLDRGVAKVVKIQGKGVDFPFDGGTATITGRRCCSAAGQPRPGHPPDRRRRGRARPARSADLAVANFENPAPNAFRYHTQGTVFSADPEAHRRAQERRASTSSRSATTTSATPARRGILDTIKNLKQYGIRPTGAGANLAAARQPAVIDVNGTKVAILGYDTIAKGYAAGPSTGRAAPSSPGRASGPTSRRPGPPAPTSSSSTRTGAPSTRPRRSPPSRRSPASVIDAGADMVIGNHAHWVGAMEVYKGKPIWYALGNFVFDQDWSEPTMEGITLELTFRGRRSPRPGCGRTSSSTRPSRTSWTRPARGRVVLGQLYDASKKSLPW